MKRSQVMIAATFIALYGCFAVSMSVSDEAIGLPPGLPEPGGGRVLPPAAEPVHREQVDDPYQPGPPRSPGARSTARSMWTRGPYASVQVNVDEYGSNIPGDAANEPSIAIDPTDPSRMVIGWRQFDTVASDFRQAGWAYSHDGGHWWTFPGVLEPGVFRSDPVLDADADGNFYYQSISPGGASLLCHIFRSTDGGLSWEPPVFAYGGDKNWMAIDRTNGIGRGNIYAIWQRFFNCCDDQTFTRSTDGGASFIYPTHIPSSPVWRPLSFRTPAYSSWPGRQTRRIPR